MGTFSENTKEIECNNCKSIVLVYWASFNGRGKKCPKCGVLLGWDFKEGWKSSKPNFKILWEAFPQ